MSRAIRVLVAMAICAASAAVAQDELKIAFPLGRTVYQTNERIDLAVVRRSPVALRESDLRLTLRGDDDSRLAFTFHAPAVPVQDDDARRTERLHLNGWLLRPGRYDVEVECDNQRASASFEVFSHVRKSTFRLMDWGDARGAQLEVLGEESMGYNLMYGHYRGKDAIPQATASIRGGLDFMQVCTMGGAHQMDIRMECDWSDPYVIRGGTARLTQQLFQNRTAPNCLGAHFYDEPGLTWRKDPATGEMTPHGIPAQVRAFKSAFGQDPIQYHQVKPDDPASVASWEHWARWKLAFVDAAWKLGRFGVEWVRPDFIASNQSQYAWYAYADGYYFNVVRSLPVISGHGGYDDMNLGYLHPSFYFEFGRMRDLAKAAWYLPAWYDDIPSDRFRLEQYLSFMTNLQGMMTPPGIRMQQPSTAPGAEGVVESNKLMGRLGTIFTTMPVARPEVAVLYSMSQCIHAQMNDMKENYGGGRHRDKLMFLYLASKLIQVPLFPVVEEDVLDGTLGTHHKAVILAGIDYLEPRVARALEAFAADGGIVLVSDDCQVKLRGLTPLGCAVDDSLAKRLGDLWQQGRMEEIWKLNLTGNYIQAAEPLARTLKARLAGLGVKPVFDTTEPGIVASKQGEGDIEYLFAVNAAYDTKVGGKNSIRPAVATLSLADDGRAIYDAVLGVPAAEFRAKGKSLKAALRFGPGQMRVYARTARPIGGVRVAPPVLHRDYTLARDPVRVEISAELVDVGGRTLAGSAPLRVLVVDPLGATRYDLHRATKLGTLRLSLPLALNDPAGAWKIVVRELLSGQDATATFAYAPPKHGGAVAGANGRAALFGDDAENVYRFFRTHHDVTVVTGKGDQYAAAAARLAEVLKPWDIRCTVVPAESVKPREMTEEEAATWCGMQPSRVKPGAGNPTAHVGFGIQGAAILLGTPKDNPVIAFIEQQGFLPYPVTPEFPGRGRGLIAWQRDAVAYERESITLIASDAAGLGEAIGTLYEVAAGLTPLTPWTLPSDSTLAAATRPPFPPPAFATVWETRLPDRAVAIRNVGPGQCVVLTEDGSLVSLGKDGKAGWRVEVPGGEKWCLDVAGDGTIVLGASQRVLAFGRTGRQLFEGPASPDDPTQVVTFVAAAPDGSRLAVGTADGKLTALTPGGQRVWTLGGVPEAETKKWETDHAKWQDDMKRWEADVKAWEEQTKVAPTANLPKPKAPDQPKKPVPEPYLAGAFDAGGATLVALTAKSAHMVNVAGGRIVDRIDGLNASVAPCRHGDSLLLGDGKRAVALVEPGRANVTAKMAMPADGAVAVAGTLDGVVVGTEADGKVRKLKALAGRLEDQLAWETALPRRVVKKVAVAGARVAVAYWGGTLVLIEGNGTLTRKQVFPQDITDLVWIDDLLVVGTADGKVIGLEVR